jgi:CHAT domain-containing protein
MNFPTTKHLINRNEQREKIESLLTQDGKGIPFAALEFFGIGGLGKSRTLEIAKQECRDKSLPFVVIDFLATDIQNAQHPDLVILLRICDNLDRITDFTSGRLFTASLLRNGKDRDLTEDKSIITDQNSLSEFHRYLADSLQSKPFILMLDSIERCPDQLFDWFGRELLFPLQTQTGAPPIIMFLAGRGQRVVERRWPITLKAATESLRLDPLEFEHTRKQINALPDGKGYSEAAKDIYALSNGHTYSTEAIIFWLNSLGVKIQDVGTQRQELAHRLREEVIRKYILADADDWVLPFLEIASYFRWFSSGFVAEFLQKYRPDELGKDLPPQWYTARLVDLQKPPLHLVYLGQDHYRIEPTLQKLLHVVTAILNPDEARNIHAEAIERLEEELSELSSRKQLSSRKTTPSILTEILYHQAHRAAISGEKADIHAELARLLKGYFNPEDVQDLALLDFLKNSIEKDAELAELVTQPVLDGLTDEIDIFLAPPPTPQQPFQLSHLIVEHTQPTEYRVSWYVANRAVVPTERVVSTQRFELNEWRDETEETGKTAFTAYLPERSQQFLRTQLDWAILLTTNRPNIPWELLHDDNNFLCLSHPIGRRPEMLQEAKVPPDRKDGPLRALVVGNPTGDLSGAEAEANAISEILKAADVEVELLLGKDATAKQFAKNIRNKTYDLIHFAGHAYFEPSKPSLSGLWFYEGPMPAEELGRHLNSRALVVLSACEAGMSKTTESKTGLVGEFIDGIATSVLLGGAIGCLAPMWEVGDGAAKTFSLSFYQHLLDGKSIGESVRQARLFVQGQEKLADAWKAWVLYGDPLQNIHFPQKGRKRSKQGKEG